MDDAYSATEMPGKSHNILQLSRHKLEIYVLSALNIFVNQSSFLLPMVFHLRASSS
jgi:hypothetical protein